MAATVSLICHLLDVVMDSDPEYPHQRRVLVDIAGFDAVEYFKLFFPDELYLFTLILDQSNLKTLQFFDQPTRMSQWSRFHTWTDKSPSELGAYVLLQLA